MIYKFLELLLKVSVRIYFKNKVITGREKIPKGKPVLFVANHPGAFLDPIVIGSYARRSLYYIARGESFQNRFSAWFFKKIHMIPVYRKEETPELTHKNKAVFGACYEHFENGRSLMIFPEGTSKIEYRLRKVKSGASRIVLGAESKNNFELGITIIPIGITYSNPMNFRTDVQVNFGDPIYVKDYQKAYQEDSFSAAKLLTKHIEKSIKEEMLLIENKENDEVFDQLQKLYFEEMVKRLQISDLKENELMKVFHTNVVSGMMLTGESIPYLKDSQGSIIFLGSVHTRRSFPGASPYAATKGALEALTSVLAAELGQYKIRVNCVIPGAVPTELNIRAGLFTKEEHDERMDAIAQLHVLKRVGTSIEIAEAIDYLIRAEWTTGSSVVVDGGLSLGMSDF